jgi:hypothetical protein
MSEKKRETGTTKPAEKPKVAKAPKKTPKAASAAASAEPETGKVIPFNPLERKHLGASVAQEMLRQPVVPLGDLPKFEGAGVYAIYYKGDFAPYAQLAKVNKKAPTLPIYVGKAIPEGGRTGVETGDAKSRLRGRLQEHAGSIKKAVSTLKIADFECRYLVVEDIWIPLGESLLISKFAPVWNTTVTGFGNHQPGKGRDGTIRPRWDELHPGRKWAVKLETNVDAPADVVAKEAEDYLRSFTIPTSQFVEEAPALPELPPLNMTDGETDV